MKRNVLRLLLAATVTLLAQGCCKPPAASVRAVTMHPQETNNWCWASTTQMITEFLGHGRTQCDLANERFGRSDCCTGTCPKNAACNMPGWTMFAESGFTTDDSGAPLSWKQLKKQLHCTAKPVSYAYGPKSGGVGHVVVISGYVEAGASKLLIVHDPWGPCAGTVRFLTYEEYSNSGATNHWQTSYNITYKG